MPPLSHALLLSVGAALGLTTLPATASALPQADPQLGDDIAYEIGVQGPTRRQRAVVPADFDGDGDLDMFLGNTGDPSYFLWNTGKDLNGDPIFVEGNPLFLPPRPVYTANAVDYDDDGDADLFLGVGGVDSVHEDRLYRNDFDLGGPDFFVDVSAAAGIQGAEGVSGPVPQATGGSAWADYDLDGDLDLYVAVHLTADTQLEHAGRNTLFRNNGDGTFTDVTPTAGVGDTGSGWQPSWIDHDNDGDPDLFVANKGGPNAFYRNNGDGTFTDVTTPALELPWTTWGSLADDLNDDGHIDLFACARSTHDHGYFLNDGLGNFTNETHAAGLEAHPSFDSEWMGFSAGDLNNDNIPEICMGAGGPNAGLGNHLFHADPPAGFIPTYLPISAQINVYPPTHDPIYDGMFPRGPYRTHGMTFADFDADGDNDLFIGNGGPSWLNLTREPNRYFRNEGGNQYNWLDVELVGVTSNSEGIGARVVVQSRLDAQATEVHAHHAVVRSSAGFGSNNRVAPHIGLLTDADIVELAIYWPSGISQVVTGVTPNGLITVTEAASGTQYASPAEFIADKMNP